MDNKLKVGFIGLGLMGIPMAKNILKKGFPLTIYNRTRPKTEELEKLGAKVSNSPSELAKNVDVVITMVTAGKDVKEVLLGEKGVVNGARKGLTVIDMSTIGPTWAREIARELSKKEIEFLDAPVTGSTPKAITGELTIFIGGKEEVFEKVKEILSAMGTNLQYMGGVGSGQGIKLINNHLIAASMVALSEGMLLADAIGLSKEKVAKTLKTVPAMSGFMNLKVDNFVKNEFPLLFSAGNMKKDLSLALDEAKKSKYNLQILEMVERLYEKTINEGLGNEDMSIVSKVIEKEKT